jgi:hypothetical protein
MPTPRAGYRNRDGVKLPSVTTILGRFKDSGGLIKWAYNQGRAHENLALRGLPGPSHLYDKVEEAAAAGTIAHDMIEHAILKRLPYGAGFELPASADNAKPEVIERAKNAFRQYERWRMNTRIRIIGTELMQVSERHGFGGTLDAVGLELPPGVSDAAADEAEAAGWPPDAIAELDGKVVLLDWKTSNAIYADYRYQLAAYALLLEECKPEWTPQTFHILRVSKENADFAHHSYGDLNRAKKIFLGWRELYDDMLAEEKRA